MTHTRTYEKWETTKRRENHGHERQKGREEPRQKAISHPQKPEYNRFSSDAFGNAPHAQNHERTHTHSCAQHRNGEILDAITLHAVTSVTFDPSSASMNISSIYLVRVSSTAAVRACPKWSDPVTLGGGMTITNFSSSWRPWPHGTVKQGMPTRSEAQNKTRKKAPCFDENTRNVSAFQARLKSSLWTWSAFASTLTLKSDLGWRNGYLIRYEWPSTSSSGINRFVYFCLKRWTLLSSKVEN